MYLVPGPTSYPLLFIPPSYPLLFHFSSLSASPVPQASNVFMVAVRADNGGLVSFTCGTQVWTGRGAEGNTTQRIISVS